MIFSSLEFIFLFLPLVLLGFMLSQKLRWEHATMYWLIAASLFFYGWWNPAYLILIVVLILANFFVGRLIANANEAPLKRLYLTAGLVLNLGVLVYYKYAGFLVENVNLATGSEFSLGTIILPLGISFFTFQKIAFLVDTYHGRVKRISLPEYSLFVLFFPQLIAGPIVHHAEIVPQFKGLNRKAVVWDNIAVGLCIFVVGLFKKVVLADTLSAYAVGPVFGAAEQQGAITFLEAWGGVLGYTLQLYFDFSGYTDMAVGAARLFGIRLPENFNSPYKSTSIIEFWRRWHITLGRFLRDYLYIALGGNRHGEARRYVNLFMTMLLGGIWHGAGWTFVIWGLLHGTYLTVNHGWRALSKRLWPSYSGSSLLSRATGFALTFLAVVVAWVFFRAESLGSAMALLTAMSGAGGIILPDSVQGLPAIGALLGSFVEYKPGQEAFGHIQGGWVLLGILALLIWCWLLPNPQEIFAGEDIVLSASPASPASPALLFRRSWQWVVAMSVAIVVCLLYLQSNVAQEFLYFDF